jgi:hypothetical protein
MSIAVFGFSENPAKDRATFRVSKSTAHKWVVLGTHVPINLKSIQAVDPAKKRIIRHKSEYKTYSAPVTDCEYFGAGELPGIKTQGLKPSQYRPLILSDVVLDVRLNTQTNQV